MSEKSLPFEVKEAGKSKSGLKRLSVLVKPEKADAVIAAIRGLHLEATIYDVKSAGKEKEKVTSGRGMGTVELAYVSRKVIVTIVDANRIDDVSAAVRGAMGGSKGVLIILPVDDLVEI
jgi:nitrogen regulatory protein PII